MAHYTQDCVEARERTGGRMMTGTIERYARRISELELEKRQQQADIAALVNLIVAQYGWQCHPTKESTTSALEVRKRHDIARPIIERYRVEATR